MHLACPFLRVNLDNASIFRTAGAQRHYFLETNDACSPNTVHIVFDLLWHVKVDHLKKRAATEVAYPFRSHKLFLLLVYVGLTSLSLYVPIWTTRHLRETKAAACHLV